MPSPRNASSVRRSSVAIGAVPSGALRSTLRRAAPLLLAAMLLACRGGGGARSPEALREAYARALAADDPAAAYALLSPELRAATSKAAFAARWKAQAGERSAARAAIETLPPALEAPLRGGETVHDGAALAWAFVGGRYQVVSGLPGLPDLSTPASAIRAFLAAVRRADLGALSALLADDLSSRLRDDWNRRADLLEQLLKQPGSIEYTPGMERAILRYEPGRALTLEQTPQGWRIVALQ
ncbi:hypothetical protein [Nannocystis bainbridge]|uniref:Lipoprotein n=1 Tax=Nannocystis bainbridge TaxID=2995303 RepID=A0ABT5E2X7_9BACT|nr:hypothetical protein [Nannocystis bainbridge]MDC0719313.1 hypothetical protein [Nannocystis bainbridge]